MLYRKYLWLFMLVLCASRLSAETVCARWAGAGKRVTYPGTLQTSKAGSGVRLVFDLSAIPTGALVHRAALSTWQLRQPRNPIRLIPIGKLDEKGEPQTAGEPLKLLPPWYASFDATEAVRTWVADPKSNLGLALPQSADFEAGEVFLDICFEGKSEKTPEPVSALKAVHHDGQTFLTWEELPRFRPKPEETKWAIFHESGYKEVPGPAEGEPGKRPVAGIQQGVLRRLQQLESIDPPKGTQEYPKYKRLGDWPEIRYRIYRSAEPIRAETIRKAELLAEVEPLCAYDPQMIGYKSWGEYYDKREATENFLATYCLEDARSIPPGRAFYVHTVSQPGKAWYAVTTLWDGTENLAAVSEANSLAQPVEERSEPLAPVIQYAYFQKYYTHLTPTKYYYWPAPPQCNVPQQAPKQIELGVGTGFKEPGMLVIGGQHEYRKDVVVLSIQEDIPYGGRLGYNAGLGTLRSYSECAVEFFSEKYTFHLIQWARSKYKIDPDRIEMGASTHFCVRHPEVFKIVRTGPYEIDFDRKWNPCRGALDGYLGPKDIAKTLNGDPAWSIYDLSWYLKQDPAKDIPFMLATHGGKESGHAVEFGWQDDPKGWRALQDARQPHIGAWGGGMSRDLRDLLGKIRWDRSVPAFSRCSLDANPGNGDPSDGDPWGQLNGYLAWEYDSIVDEPERWEMTVFVGADCWREDCTVDLTPRHRKAFRPQAGDRLAWSNTESGTEKVLQSGTIEADRWGLVTLKDLAISKKKNRIKIEKRP